MWGAIIKVHKSTVNMCCDNHNIAKFSWKKNNLAFQTIHNHFVQGQLIGVLPQKKLKTFFQTHKPKVKAQSLTAAVTEIIHSICEKSGANFSQRIFSFNQWKQCDFELNTSKLKAAAITPILSSSLPCVQELARVEHQMGQLGLVCNKTDGISKHQPIGFFNGQLLTQENYYKTVTSAIIHSERHGYPCNRTSYALCLGKHHILDAWQTRSYVSAANHSCGNSANARVEYWIVHGFSFLVLVSIKQIPFNTPIVHDYGKRYLLTNNQVCYGIFCKNHCNFKAMCEQSNDGRLIFHTQKNKTVIIPQPPLNIHELKKGKTHCHVAISNSTLFSHSCIVLFFRQTTNRYFWTFQ